MIGHYIPGAGPAGGGLGDLPGGDPLGGLHPDPAGHLESRQTQEYSGLCVKIKQRSFWTRKVSGDCDRKKEFLTTTNVLKPCLKCLLAM